MLLVELLVVVSMLSSIGDCLRPWRHPLANRMPKHEQQQEQQAPLVNTPYTVSYFNQRVDHFNFLLPAAGETFKQRVLYSYQVCFLSLILLLRCCFSFRARFVCSISI
jgi:hypothetical protein